jgi:glycerol-3-phosphate dehydrogenase
VTGERYDLAVIGGGINGCGIARDAAGRGLSVLLLEKRDLASGTSSASTKLIHGGLRYLELYEFRLVRESLMEREVLLGMAPHIVHPLRFVLPIHNRMRPAWLIRLGLFLYDHLGKRSLLDSSRLVDLRAGELGAPLKPQFARGFEYSDCRVDDARLVVLNAMDAARHGARVRVRTEFRSAARQGGEWRLLLRDQRTGVEETAAARVLVNASGPWVSEVISRRLGLAPRLQTRLVKGSHIVVPRLFGHSRAYIFQNADKRIIFAIPYEQSFTLIGTTDVDYEDSADAVDISGAEVDYLCAAASEYFAQPVQPGHIVWSYSGVRPLYDDGGHSASETTRDYVLDLDAPAGQAPLLNIFGGKLTTYRCLAEEALALLREWLPGSGPPWTARAPLPGGNLGAGRFATFSRDLARSYPGLDSALVARLAGQYGMLAREILAGAKTPGDLGRHFGADLYEREVRYLMRHEWALEAADIVWRRTKLGLRMSAEEIRQLGDWMRAHPPLP